MDYDYLCVGEVLRPQGVRGEVKVKPITSDITRFEDLKRAYILKGGDYAPVNTRFVRLQADAVYLEIEGVTSRDDAEKLRGALIYVERAHAVKLGEHENFIVDLIGLTGVDDEGNEYGELTDVMQPGGNDVYVFNKNGRETLVPALRTAVLNVDLKARRVYMSAKRLREVAVTDDI